MHTTGFSMYTKKSIATLFALVLAPYASAQDGTLDAAWFGGGRRTIDVGESIGGGIAFQSDGKAIVWGTCRPPFEIEHPCLTRLFPSGDVDATFGPTGTGSVHLNQFANFPASLAAGVLVRSDDSLLIAANRDNLLQGFIVARMSGDGDVLLGTSSFQFDSSSAQPRSGVIAVTAGPEDTMLVAGSGNNAQQLALARIAIDAEGLPTLDSNFANGGVRLIPFASISSAKMGDVHVAPDGKLLVLTKHHFWYANPDFGTLSMFRFLANGERDMVFGEIVVPKCAGTDAIFNEQLITDVTGRIIVAWGAWYPAPAPANPPADICVNRLLQNGTQDPSFGGLALLGIAPGPLAINVGREDAPNFSAEFFGDVVVGADGKIIVAGLYIGTVPSCVGCAMTARLTEFPFIGHTLDTSYGNNGVSLWQYTTSSNYDRAEATVMAQGGLLVAGSSSIFSTGSFQTAAAKLRLGPQAFDPIFANGFEQPLEP
jgi:uncharacterized delta-60 repeat protein